LITEAVKHISMGVCIAGIIFISFWFINNLRGKGQHKEIQKEIEVKSNELNSEFKNLVALTLTTKKPKDTYYFYQLRKRLRNVSEKRNELDCIIDKFLKRREEKDGDQEE
jgi:hypothetical protein